mgnify:CR=1 FL=1
MVKKFPDLERGESASLTGRDHIPPRVFKEMTRLTKQKSKLEDLLTGINPFNAKSRAEEICKILDTYIPSVEKMDTLLRKYGVASRKQHPKTKLKRKCRTGRISCIAQKVSTLKQIEDLKLRRDYDSAVAILEQIPAEVLNIYAQSSHRGKERLLSKVYDDPKYNAAFDRCVDVMARLLQKVRATAVGQMQETERMAVHSLRHQESNPFLCIRNLTKPLDIN